MKQLPPTGCFVTGSTGESHFIPDCTLEDIFNLLNIPTSSSSTGYILIDNAGKNKTIRQLLPPRMHYRDESLKQYIREQGFNSEHAPLIAHKIINIYDLHLFDQKQFPYPCMLYSVLVEAIIANIGTVTDDMSSDKLIELVQDYYPIYCKARRMTPAVKGYERGKKARGIWFNEHNPDNKHRLTAPALCSEFHRSALVEELSPTIKRLGWSRFANHLISVLKEAFNS